ncbi:hypothetical protein BaRGS_00004481 [Batillaria attramentaria]|uniref:protein-histidine N-methyltransferase n=1 Tax=Batillaria attramentaria TaxID=370345 RepID=A0ABD0LYY7_9CAEN
MGRKNKRGGGGGGAKAAPQASGGKEGDAAPALSKSAKREVTELIAQLLEICSKPPSSGAKELEDYPEIHGLVEKIRKIQSTVQRTPGNREDAFPTFFEWLHNNGVDTSAVEIQMFPGYGHGLKAARDVKESELLLKIPRSLMLTVDSALKSPLGEVIKDDKILQVMPNVTLAMHLLLELYTPDSFWKPYIDTLPPDYTTPLYFTPEELQYLKGSPTLGNSITQYRSIARQYAYFYRLLQKHPAASKLPLKDNFTFDDYRWAVSTVMTRQNLIPKKDDGDKKTFGLMPLWDMCNHANGIYNTDFDVEKDCSLCYSQQDVAAGEQIFMFYGPRSNGEFLVHNGFVYPENEHDRLCLKLGISKGDALLNMKSMVLRKINLSASRSFYLHRGECPVDGEMLAFLRVFCMDEDTLRSQFAEDADKEKLEGLKELETSVSKDNEEKVWAFLETRASLLLKSYPTTVQEDDAQLKQTDLPNTLRMALQLRVGEKRILQQTVAFAGRRKQAAKDSTDTPEASYVVTGSKLETTIDFTALDKGKMVVLCRWYSLLTYLVTAASDIYTQLQSNVLAKGKLLDIDGTRDIHHFQDSHISVQQRDVHHVVETVRIVGWTSAVLIYDHSLELEMLNKLTEMLSWERVKVSVIDISHRQWNNSSDVGSALSRLPFLHVVVLTSYNSTHWTFSKILDYGERSNTMHRTTFKSEWIVWVDDMQSRAFQQAAKAFENVAVVMRNQTDGRSLWTMTRNGNKVRLQFVASFPQATPLSRLQVFPNPAHGLTGRTLRVITKPWENFVVESGDGNASHFYGMCMDLLEELSATLNFSYTITGYQDRPWNHLIIDLEEKKADLLAVAMVLSHNRVEVADATTPFYYDDITLVYKQSESRFGIFKNPFQTDVYTLLCGSFCFVLCLLVCFETTVRWAGRSAKRTHTMAASGTGHVGEDETVAEDGSGGIWVHLPRTFFLLLAGILNRPMADTLKSRAGRVLVWAWLVLGVILASVFSSKLTSSLTLSSQSASLRSLAHLVELDSYTWGVLPDTAQETFLKESQLPAVKTFYERLLQFAKADPTVLAPDEEVHIQKCLNERYVFLEYRVEFKSQRKHHCELTSVPERIFPVGYTFFLQKGSPYTELMSQEIGRMFETGLMAHWESKWWPRTMGGSCGDGADVAGTERVIRLPALHTVFLLAVVGLCLAAITLTAECILTLTGSCSLWRLARAGDDVKLQWVSPLPATDPLYRLGVFPNPAHGLAGRTLRIITKSEPSQWLNFVVETGDGGTQQFRGLCIDLLEELAARLNFSYTLTGYQDRPWNELITDLAKKKADFVALSMVVSHSRRQIADATTPFYYDDITLVYKLPGRSFGSPSNPFRTHVYILLCGAFSLVLLLVSCFETTVGLLGNSTGERDIEEMEDCGRSVGNRIVEYSVLLFAGILNKPMEHRSVSHASRVLVWAWLLLGLVLASVYSSRLTSSMASGDQALPFTSLAQLVNLDSYTWGVLSDSALETFLKESQLPTVTTFYKKLQQFAQTDPTVLAGDIETHIAKCLNNQYVFLDYRVAYESLRENYCELTSVPERIFPVSYAFYLQKGSPYTELVSQEYVHNSVND